MLDTVLHLGVEHPGVLWVLVPSLLSFLAGLGVGIRSDRLWEWLRPQQAEAPHLR